MSVNNELSNELFRLFSKFRDAKKNWKYKEFDSYGFGLGLAFGGGMSGGPLKIKHTNKVGTFDLVYKCLGVNASIGAGLSVNVNLPLNTPVGRGTVLANLDKKLEFSSFEGTYLGFEFASSSLTPITGYTVMAMVTGVSISYGSLFGMSRIEMIRQAHSGKAIIFMLDTQLTGPSVGFNTHIGRSFLFSNDAVFDPITAPSIAPILSVGDRVHEVKQGEWLSKIAQKYYGNYTKWEALYNWDWNEGANKDWNKKVIGNNPDLIEPGMKIIIPPRNVIDQYRK